MPEQNLTPLETPHANPSNPKSMPDSNPNLPGFTSTDEQELVGFPKGKLGTLRSLAGSFGKRVLFGVITLIFIIFLTYFGLSMARGIEIQPALLQGAENTVEYLGHLLQGDLGRTAEYGYARLATPISEVLPQIMVRSLGLLTASLIVAAIIGVSLGIWSANRRHTPLPLLTLLGTVIGISLPSFFFAIVLQLSVIQLTKFLGRTILPIGGFGWDIHMLLPALVLASRPLAQITRVTYVIFGDVLDQEYIRTAQSKGVHRRRILTRHAIRNAAVPVLTTIGLSLRFSLSSLPVVEFFFGWQGLGYHLLKAISNRDDELAIAMLLCLGAFFILVNLLLELSYNFIDPRLRTITKQATMADRSMFTEFIKSLPYSIRSFLTDNIVTQWFRRRRSPIVPGLQDLIRSEKQVSLDGIDDLSRVGTRRAWLKGTLGNIPFMFGGILVLILLIIVLFGADITPHSPYTTRGLEYTDGEFIVPPFKPDEVFPWGTDMLGRDIMSLILAGAQQTFVLTALVVLARIVVGFLLGAIAGWWHGSWLDRLLLGFVEVIATFPTLLLAMNLILALNIRNGMPPFIIGLCFVGWGEIMQFVRGEVMRIRPMLFIESAIATGARTTRIIISHALPNLIPSLISITALEMGAVLMLLGELGFVGIFIGGGTFAEMEWMTYLFHYSDVPEWGALLSNVRTYARSYPWMAIYPSLAFFIAILALNIFGEGLRRLVDQVGVRIMGLVNRYTIALAVLMVVGFLTIRGSTGELTTYQNQAIQFNGYRALADVEALTLPSLEGRAIGSSGMNVAAAWIAQQFESLGIQPAGEEFSYFQSKSRSYQVLDVIPSLAIGDGGPGLIYHQDYNEYAGNMRSTGITTGEVHLVLFGEVTETTNIGGYARYPSLELLDFSEKIVLTVESDMFYIEQVRPKGALVIASDPSDLQRRMTLSDSGWISTRPALYISEEVADRILAGSGYSVDSLKDLEEELLTDECFELLLKQPVAIDVRATSKPKMSVNHVIGHMPSYVSNQFGGMDDQLIVVLAQYDCPPISQDGAFHACANNNASGVAVMLEIIRNMRATGYQPYRTFLFIAYSGEGREGGEPVTVQDVSQFLKAKFGFASNYRPVAVVELRGLGVNYGEGLSISVDGSLRLADLFESASRRMGVEVNRFGEQVEISRIFSPGGTAEKGEEAPRVTVRWSGWEKTAFTEGDSIDRISAEALEKAGRAMSLALMILGREINY